MKGFVSKSWFFALVVLFLFSSVSVVFAQTRTRPRVDELKVRKIDREQVRQRERDDSSEMVDGQELERLPLTPEQLAQLQSAFPGASAVEAPCENPMGLGSWVHYEVTVNGTRLLCRVKMWTCVDGDGAVSQKPGRAQCSPFEGSYADPKEVMPER